MNKPVIECQLLSKSFDDGVSQVDVLRSVDFTVNAGERIAIVGPSGSGKSTLLHLLGGLDKPSSGDVFLLGENISTMSESVRCKERNQHLGFIYQFHHLLPEFSALENVMMPLLIGGFDKADAKARATKSLTEVGLVKRLQHKPSQLSGGERQRVAIARALVTEPSCVLADEPTGNLDSETAETIFDLFLSINQSRQTAIVIVTHDRYLASRMQKTLTLKSGKLN